MSGRCGALGICSRGIYSCNWKHSSERRRRCACCWFSFVGLATLLSLAWLFIWMALYNSRDDMNVKVFEKMKEWINWFMVIVIISAVLAIYSLLLLEPLDLHCVHKVFLSVGVLIVLAGVMAISLRWKEEWPTVPVFLQATAPFLQLGAVGALTFLSWLVFKTYSRARRSASRVLIMLAWAVVSLVVFLCPLLIHDFSPCVLEELPPKPALVGHRGAPMLAPENTMMSFKRSLECNVTAFETDVLLSKDGHPFLMHDNHSLRRTTNVEKIFPRQEKDSSNNFTWSEIRRLNAGQGFLDLQNDPLQRTPSLSDTEWSDVRNQSVPSFHELLDLAKEHNVSIIFDLKNETPSSNDANYTVQTILASGIAQNLIWWLPPVHRADVKRMAPGFRQVYGSLPALRNDSGSHLNVKYNHLSTKEMRELRNKNVSVNLWVVNERWLFSLAWCSGASSVTTNACHIFNDMARPDWTLEPMLYRMIWISADLVSLLVMFGLFLLQREKRAKKRARRQIFGVEPERTVPLLAI
ncbi:glycerophosphoinositol inositolphosphodiesterase GDPD2 isoform X2 [Sardina pilchardus]|uniref:glycerophosphoinositol inositolphosphodiesterase GDPD2 isoform X2 n=1 Tax=Sardina pilchardus TaxID=27697 RepID=UPI002E12A737